MALVGYARLSSTSQSLVCFQVTNSGFVTSDIGAQTGYS